jgi:hypothetical protein
MLFFNKENKARSGMSNKLFKPVRELYLFNASGALKSLFRTFCPAALNRFRVLLDFQIPGGKNV